MIPSAPEIPKSENNKYLLKALDLAFVSQCALQVALLVAGVILSLH